MAYKMISIKCPDCGQSLEIAENRTQAFCTYCGAKVLISNENEYIYRQIDEAAVQQAETERMIKMQQLEIEKKESERKRQYITIWLAIVIILIVLGIVGIATGIPALVICLYIAFFLGIGGFVYLDDHKNTRKVLGPNDVKITSAMRNYTNKHYSALAGIFETAGFRNIKTIPLCDLTFITSMKDGKIADISIDGNSQFLVGTVFSKDAQIVITYHSRK